MNPHLELGLMLPSTSGGLIIADATPPQSVPTWELNRNATLAAEAGGMEFVLSQVKWRGFGGPSKHWDAALESFTLMAGLASVTSSIQLYASVAVRTMNPAVAAKMAATIAEISGGRFGLNIVAGWNKYEYAQMGLWQDDDYYLNRYEYAQEYLTILKQLWTQEKVTFKGKFFTMEDCTSWPKPAKPLKIVCAGQSDAAVAFVAKESDYAFVGRQNDSAEQLGTLARRISDLGAGHGRDVGSYTLLNLIAEETDALADEKKRYYVEKRDDIAIQEFLRASGNDINRTDYAKLDPVTVTFMSVPYVAASYQSIARHLDNLAAGGVRGVCLTFPDFATDVPMFVEKILPLMRARNGGVAAVSNVA